MFGFGDAESRFGGDLGSPQGQSQGQSGQQGQGSQGGSRGGNSSSAGSFGAGDAESRFGGDLGGASNGSPQGGGQTGQGGQPDASYSGGAGDAVGGSVTGERSDATNQPSGVAAAGQGIGSQPGGAQGTGQGSGFAEIAGIGSTIDLAPTGFNPTGARGQNGEERADVVSASLPTTPTSYQGYRETERAEQARAAERTSMDVYNAAVEQSRSNTSRADLAQQARASENRSMIGRTKDATDLEQMILGANLISGRFNGALTPEDVLAIISYETAGTFNKNQPGPTTQWGQHVGLIQWGEPQRAEYGITDDSTVLEQMEAIGDYLSDRGFTDKMGIEQAYAAINAGGVSDAHLGMTDENNGGAPGTVSEKVSEQFGPHYENARAVLDGAYGRSNFAMSGQRNQFADIPGTVPTAPADRFEATYLGREYSDDAESLFGGQGRAIATQPSPAYQAQDFTAAPAPASEYTDLPDQGPVPSYAPSDRPESLGERIGAGIINAGVSMIPGVGPVATGFNAIAGLTGNRTIGERAIDWAQSLPGDGVPMGQQTEPGRGLDPLDDKFWADKKDKDDDKDKPRKRTVKRFVERYMDNDNFPSPWEKWDRPRLKGGFAGV